MRQVVKENGEYYFSGFKSHYNDFYLLNDVPVPVIQEKDEYYVHGIKMKIQRKKRESKINIRL